MITPRPWYRSPVLWFAMPVFVFLCVAWIDSMSTMTDLVIVAPAQEVWLTHHSGKLDIHWYDGHLRGRSGGSWHLVLEPRRAEPGYEWLPLPGSLFRSVFLPHWLLILVLAGLWQLPWLGRYFWRKRIAAREEEYKVAE